MFGPTKADIIRDLGSVEKAEEVTTALSACLDTAVPAGQEQLLLERAISEVSQEAGLSSVQERAARALIAVSSSPSERVVSELKFKDGIDPREAAAVKERLEDEQAIVLATSSARRELLVGRIFRAMEETGFRPTWEKATEVFDRNCELVECDGIGQFKFLALTEVGSDIAAQAEKRAADGFGVIDRIVSERDGAPLMKELLERFLPGCELRAVSHMDVNARTLLDTNSHIMRQGVVSSSTIEAYQGRIPRVVDAKLYLSDLDDPALYSHVTHELLEMGIMQHLLNSCQGTDVPSSFLVQYLAELKFSDVLVWTCQFRDLDKTLSLEEKVEILDRAFIVCLSAENTVDVVRRIAGDEHPVTQEMKLYYDTFKMLVSRESPYSYRAAAKEPQDRQSGEQQRYGLFLPQFFKRYLDALADRAPANMRDDLLLVNPRTLVECGSEASS